MTELPRYELTEDGVSQALADLGRNPEDIAARLAELGIKGERWSEDKDVTSNFLRAVLPPFEHIYVWAHDVRIEWLHTDQFGFITPVTTTVLCTPAQGAFIEQSDNGMYPELEKEASDATAG